MALMQNKIRFLAMICLAAVLGLPSDGRADADDPPFGLYLSLDAAGGLARVDDAEVVNGTPSPNLTENNEYDMAAGGGLALGFDWRYLFPGVTLRNEIEFFHLVRIDVDSRPVFRDTLPALGVENNMSTTTIMFNTEYEFDLGTWYWPFVGFGVGYARNHSEPEWNNLVPSNQEFIEEDTDVDNVAFSAQFGLGFKITDRWWTDAGYRYIYVGEAAMQLTDAGFTDTFRIEWDDLDRHELRFGFNYRF